MVNTPRERRVLVGGEHQAARDRGDVGRACAPLRLMQLVFEAAAGAEADDRRQVEGEDVRLADRLELAASSLRDEAVDADSAGVLALVERLEQHDEQARCSTWPGRRASCSRRPT